MLGDQGGVAGELEARPLGGPVGDIGGGDPRHGGRGGTTGGSLPPGNSFLKFTETNGSGETTPSSESAEFTVAPDPSPSVAATGTVGGSPGGIVIPRWTLRPSCR